MIEGMGVRDANGKWAVWALELRAAPRNKAVKMFNLSAEEAEDLRKAGRQWKQSFQQQNYVQRVRISQKIAMAANRSTATVGAYEASGIQPTMRTDIM